MVLTLQVVFVAKSRTKLKSNTNLKGRVNSIDRILEQP